MMKGELLLDNRCRKCSTCSKYEEVIMKGKLVWHNGHRKWLVYEEMMVQRKLFLDNGCKK